MPVIPPTLRRLAPRREQGVSRNAWRERVAPALDIGAHARARRLRARPALPSALPPPARPSPRARIARQAVEGCAEAIMLALRSDRDFAPILDPSLGHIAPKRYTESMGVSQTER